MTSKRYVARVLPVNRFHHVLDARKGPTWERFDEFCFAGSASKPQEILVDRGHRERVIGRCTGLVVRDGWWTATFGVDHEVGEHLVSVGHPVSAQFTPWRERDGEVLGAHLGFVSLVDRGMYDGAEVTRVFDLDDPDLLAPQPLDAGLAASLRSHGVNVPDLRPKPRQPARVIEHIDAPGKVLIRPGIGRITAVY